LTVKRIIPALAAVALAAIVIGCFISQLYQQQNFQYAYIKEGQTIHLEIYSSLASFEALTINNYILPAFPTALTVQASNTNRTCLNNYTRGQIFDFVNQTPGVQFRAICAALCLPVGLAEYHLGVLVKAGLVSFVRDGRYKRFFVSKRFSKRDMALICLLRHKTTKKIIEALLSKRELSHGKLAGEVSITSQALTWQMKTLKNTEFVLQVNDGLRTVYSLDKSSTQMLAKYVAVIR
jgi:DNA-binding transcriptional ArsR family regulator